MKRMELIGKHQMYTLTQCPKNYSIGIRTKKSAPGQMMPDYVGNQCEPWIARFSLIFLDRLLDSGARPAPCPCAAGLQLQSGTA